jgi:hypothetical protein
MTPHGSPLLPLAIGGLLLLAVCAPAPARAGTEEFSTFDVEEQEEDDESLIDHVLTRYPHPWRAEWERATMALRTSQGCLTSGQWFIDTDLKLVAPLGGRAQFGLALRQNESDISSYDYLDFTFRFPTARGTPGAMFRPLHDKSRQDFAFTYDWGADTTALQIQTAFTFEDVFNNFWAFRQTRVGNASEPYEKRPYEPGLRIVSRNARWRAEAGGRWLTSSIKRVQPAVSGGPERWVGLWGTLGWASIETHALGVTWDAITRNHQARSTDEPVDLSTADNADFRRSWSAEFGATRALTPRLGVEARFLYQERNQAWGAPYGPGFLDVIERMSQIETTWRLTPALIARVGGMYDHVGVERAGPVRVVSYGDRNESRAYVGLSAKFGRVWVMGIEGIELDPEPYDVWLVHDKGFLQMQARF